jgi:hypothetical protein
MNKHAFSLLRIAAAAILAPTSIFAGTTTVTWDNQPDLGTFSTPPTPTLDGYNFFFGDSTFGDVGPNDNSHGPLQYYLPGNPLLGGFAAYNAWGDTPIRVESLAPTTSDAFTFSGYFSSQYNLGPGAAQVLVEGFTGASSTPSFTTTFTLPSDGSWVDESFTLGGYFNKFLFSPEDSNGNPSAFVNGYIAMDNVSLTTVPDAGSTGLLLGIGFGAIAYLRRKLA